MRELKTDNEFLITVKRGLDIAYERMLDYKIMKNSVVVVMRDNKMVHLDPRTLKEEWLNFKMQSNYAY